MRGVQVYGAQVYGVQVYGKFISFQTTQNVMARCFLDAIKKKINSEAGDGDIKTLLRCISKEAG